MLIVGSGVTGTVTVQEGVQAPWAVTGELVGPFDTELSINDAGHYAFATNLGGTAPTTTDEQIVGFTGSFVVPAEEGKPVPGFPTQSWGINLNSPSISNASQFGFGASTSPAATADEFLFFNNVAVAQEDVTIPTGQAGGGTQTWDVFTAGKYYTASDGVTWLAQGDLNGTTNNDAVVVYNGAVVVQEDGVIAGIGGPVETIVETIMTSNGDWFSKGDIDSQEDWLVGKGGLVAKTGDPVPNGLPGEVLDDTNFAPTFFSMTGDGNGNYVYGAVTNNVATADAVLVSSVLGVLLREGDGVDLDGNGILDDNVFLSVFNNDDAFLTPDGWYYFTADLVDGSGAALGQGFMRVQIPEPATAGLIAVCGLLGRRARRL